MKTVAWSPTWTERDVYLVNDAIDFHVEGVDDFGNVGIAVDLVAPFDADGGDETAPGGNDNGGGQADFGGFEGQFGGDQLAFEEGHLQGVGGCKEVLQVILGLDEGRLGRLDGRTFLLHVNRVRLLQKLFNQVVVALFSLRQGAPGIGDVELGDFDF